MVKTPYPSFCAAPALPTNFLSLLLISFHAGQATIPLIRTMRSLLNFPQKHGLLEFPQLQGGNECRNQKSVILPAYLHHPNLTLINVTHLKINLIISRKRSCPGLHGPSVLLSFQEFGYCNTPISSPETRPRGSAEYPDRKSVV